MDKARAWREIAGFFGAGGLVAFDPQAERKAESGFEPLKAVVAAAVVAGALLAPQAADAAAVSGAQAQAVPAAPVAGVVSLGRDPNLARTGGIKRFGADDVEACLATAPAVASTMPVMPGMTLSVTCAEGAHLGYLASLVLHVDGVDAHGQPVFRTTSLNRADDAVLAEAPAPRGPGR